MAKIGIITGILCILLSFGSAAITFDIGFYIFAISCYFWWIDRNPENASWWGGESKLPWAQDMADVDKKMSELRAQRKIDEWKSKRPR